MSDGTLGIIETLRVLKFVYVNVYNRSKYTMLIITRLRCDLSYIRSREVLEIASDYFLASHNSRRFRREKQCAVRNRKSQIIVEKIRLTERRNDLTCEFIRCQKLKRT